MSDRTLKASLMIPPLTWNKAIPVIPFSHRFLKQSLEEFQFPRNLTLTDAYLGNVVWKEQPRKLPNLTVSF